MKKVCLLLLVGCVTLHVRAQSITQKLAAAVRTLENDPQMAAALVSIYVADVNTGEVVFEKNSRYGVAPASTQKLFTAASAFALLGSDFRYKTTVAAYADTSSRSGSAGYITIAASGDPSLGSWRYESTASSLLLNKWKTLIKAVGQKRTWKNVYIVPPPGQEGTNVSGLIVPDGYIWQDIGNYYGAGVSGLNWNENQYDLVFRTSKPGTGAELVRVEPMQDQLRMQNLVTAGETGSGDNAYIYAAPHSRHAIIRGTLPPMKNEFTISGSMPDPAFSCISQLREVLYQAGLISDTIPYDPVKPDAPSDGALLGAVDHFSPSLDSLVHWFLRKSINLYGEALIRTMALQVPGTRPEQGPQTLKSFWVSNGIKPAELNFYDGSGLSPQNRVTTKALVQVLRYAARQNWAASFRNALPTYNGMKMKSGSINGARAYAGYHQSASGKNFAFAIVINNYSGSASAAVNKMYKVLDQLK